MKAPHTEWRLWSTNIEALYLGEIIVGRVATDGGGRSGKLPRAIFNLAAIESGAFWWPVASIDSGKLLVEGRLSDWLRTAGLQ
jgi:hypothetical protein